MNKIIVAYRIKNRHFSFSLQTFCYLNRTELLQESLKVLNQQVNSNIVKLTIRAKRYITFVCIDRQQFLKIFDFSHG